MGESVETLLNSETPNLPAAKATINVILIYIPVRSAGGGLSYFQADDEQLDRDHEKRTGHDETYNRQQVPPFPERRRRILYTIKPFHKDLCWSNDGHYAVKPRITALFAGIYGPFKTILLSKRTRKMLDGDLAASALWTRIQSKS